jgi:hypothetical protein
MQGAWWALGIAVASIAALAYYAFVVLPARIHRWRCAGLRAFARLIALRTQGRYGNAEPMAELASAVALRLGMPLHERRRMELAVYLRDIGMVAIPYSHPQQAGAANARRARADGDATPKSARPSQSRFRGFGMSRRWCACTMWSTASSPTPRLPRT